MTDVSYVAAGYVIVSAGIGSYVAWLLARGRRLARQVPEDRRRWT
jgi:CcmD family protein